MLFLDTCMATTNRARTAACTAESSNLMGNGKQGEEFELSDRGLIFRFANRSR